jgi:hypothetical protein
MDKRFLLLYSYENTEGMLERNFKWYKNEEQMRENIKDLKEFIKEFTVNKAIEVLQARNIEI